MRFRTSYGIVSLTEERKGHILAFHPDVASCFSHFSEALAQPDFTTVSAHDAAVIIFYRFLARRKKYLAIVVKVTKQSFILTAYIAKKPKSGTL